jgi:hypothetical protein
VHVGGKHELEVSLFQSKRVRHILFGGCWFGEGVSEWVWGGVLGGAVVCCLLLFGDIREGAS